MDSTVNPPRARVLTLDGSVPADWCPDLGTPVIGMS